MLPNRAKNLLALLRDRKFFGIGDRRDAAAALLHASRALVILSSQFLNRTLVNARAASPTAALPASPAQRLKPPP
jgi:hypothetical protein